jgi:cysteinyl-tRNA synthetase
MNITDVGHLTSDADEGEDKMMKALRREHLPVSKESMLKLADKYTEHFKKNIQDLNILPPTIWCKATEHIPQMLGLIKKIEKNDFTYESDSAIYFDISRDKNYGKLAKLNLKELEAGARVDVDEEKHNPHDFVLWFKITGKHKNHLMKWDSPYGQGFPGWHIECSAMSTYYLGDQFDIHAGGIDHIPVHHTNEIAQTEAATKKHPWVKYWVHGEFLVLNKEKLSKSTGGSFLTIETLKEKGYDPLSYRYFCLTAHYRKPLNFSFEALDSAQIALNKLREKVLEIKNDNEAKGNAEKYIESFQKAINDDLNMPQALAVVWELIKDDKVNNKTKYNTLLDFDRVLGLNLKYLKEIKIPKDILTLAQRREDARLKKDWKESDEIRDQLKTKGYIISDTPNGFVLKKI